MTKGAIRNRVLVLGTVFIATAGSLAGAQTSDAAVAVARASAPKLSPAGSVPRVVKFSGTLRDAEGKACAITVGVSFALYKEQEGGIALWLETQNVSLDAQGHYTVLLGASKAEDLPLDLFASNEARWLGVQVENQAAGPNGLLNLPS